ncbi:hypothetical protein PUN28_016703 [Cardiocondyla obscurior]|uniref:Uncharacterized protein n=1 Tax=Cardiocondyla obscurior TaxID=286306 RepID=A0AAW2ES39_9HYME
MYIDSEGLPSLPSPPPSSNLHIDQALIPPGHPNEEYLLTGLMIFNSMAAAFVGSQPRKREWRGHARPATYALRVPILRTRSVRSRSPTTIMNVHIEPGHRSAARRRRRWRIAISKGVIKLTRTVSLAAASPRVHLSHREHTSGSPVLR